MRSPSRYPLGVYLGLLLVVILVVGVLVGLYASGQSKNAVTASAAKLSEVTAQQSAQLIATEFNAKTSALVSMANDPMTAGLLAATPPGCRLPYGPITKDDRGHVDLLTLDGRDVCTSTAAAGPSYAAAQWLRPDAPGLQVDGLYHDARAGWSVVVAVPVGHVGVMAEFISTSPLAHLAHQTYSAAQPYEFLLETARGERVVSRSIEPTRWVGVPIAQTAFDRGDSAVRPDLDGMARIYGRATVAGPGWILYTGIAESAALSGANAAEVREFFFILGGFLISVLATVLVYRRITRPLRQLSDAVTASSVMTDDVIDIEVHGPREVQMLGEAIHSLSASVHRELLDRRKAEAEARASELAYRTLFAESPLAMWVFRWPDGLLGVNEAAVALYGYDSDELTAMRIGSVWVDEVPDEVRAALERGAPLEQSGPWRQRRKDGSVIEVLLSCRSIVFGATEAQLLITEDVTDHERMQRQIRQTERLESLGQLAGGVAHDFNNLLGVIMSYLAFVREWAVAQAGEAGDAGVLADLDQIDVATSRAADLTRQLLAFARRESVSPRPIRVSTVIEQVQRLLSRSLGERTELVTVLDDEDDEDATTIVADPGQMEQVFINLAVNARDAMPDGGTVTIAVTTVDLNGSEAPEWTLPAGRYTRISVRDTGTGMTPDVLQHAFEPFFTTKPAGKGTGLGLSSIYGTVTSAGGSIRIDSEPGQGTDVVMLFPLARESETESVPSAPRSGADGAGRTALVVEDEPGLRSVIQRMLERNGYRVVVAGDGPSAIALSRGYDGTVDLLLTDVVMPKMQGTELADAIRLERPDIVVVYMSGYARDAFAESGARPAALIEKPFREDQLLEVLRQHMPG